jgi:hypothetical protein
MLLLAVVLHPMVTRITTMMGLAPTVISLVMIGMGAKTILEMAVVTTVMMAIAAT